MPVNTTRALATGRRFWNYPKFLAEIEVEERSGCHRCTLAEGGEPILTVEGPSIATPSSALFRYHASTLMDGQPQRSEFRVNALEFGLLPRPGGARIALGERHPMALELSEALLSRRAIGWSVTSRFEAILFGSERATPSHLGLIDKGLRAIVPPGLPERAPEREGPRFLDL